MITFSSLPLPSPFHPKTLRPSSSKPGKLRSRKLAGSNASVLWIWVNRLWCVSMFGHSIICLKFKHQTVPIGLKGIMIHDPSWSIMIHHDPSYKSLYVYRFVWFHNISYMIWKTLTVTQIGSWEAPPPAIARCCGPAVQLPINQPASSRVWWWKSNESHVFKPQPCWSVADVVNLSSHSCT